MKIFTNAKTAEWLLLNKVIETEDPLFVRSHVTSEFLEATCESSSGYCDVCKVNDPFCPHQTGRSAHVNGGATSSTGTQPWGTPIATSPSPCPVCGERSWWSYQDSCVTWQQDEDETLEDMYDWK